MVCPHSAIRIKAYDPAALENAPARFKSSDAKERDWKGLKYTVQVAPEDCTGCGLCVDVCPARNKSEVRLKAINMEPQLYLREAESANWQFFLDLPEMDRRQIKAGSIRQQQVQEPLFEFSGACSGCGETPYLKLVSQLFGDRMIVANATGCSSIYGGNLPTTPWASNDEGRGPAWSNSLFEDNAEFGLGFRLSIDKQREYAAELVEKLAPVVGDELATEILHAGQTDESDIYEQRRRVAALKEKLSRIDSPDARHLLDVADTLVKRSVWIVGGDGWAYDIGYGGLDHVLSMNRNVNVLVLDTEVYSNTGGQQSKATPLGAAAKFAIAGKSNAKKDLGLLAMAYEHVYVARVAFGAKDSQTLKALVEAESYPGTSLVIAYSHCIAHGYDLSLGLEQQKLAVVSGYWPLFRFDPRRRAAGQPALVLDSGPPSVDLTSYTRHESRFRMVEQANPDRYKALMETAQANVRQQYAKYEELASAPVKQP
jgi:pyruvate-ferredoxin/flavodoxin oxidoreductase